jgi:hypothetical protein
MKTLILIFSVLLCFSAVSSDETYFCSVERSLFITEDSNKDFSIGSVDRKPFKFQVQGEKIKLSDSFSNYEFRMNRFYLGGREVVPTGSREYFPAIDESGGIFKYLDGNLLMTFPMSGLGVEVLMAKCSKF